MEETLDSIGTCSKNVSPMLSDRLLWYRRKHLPGFSSFSPPHVVLSLLISISACCLPGQRRFSTRSYKNRSALVASARSSRLVSAGRSRYSGISAIPISLGCRLSWNRMNDRIHLTNRLATGSSSPLCNNASTARSNSFFPFRLSRNVCRRTHCNPPRTGVTDRVRPSADICGCVYNVHAHASPSGFAT